jgi:hypothetical protein
VQPRRESHSNQYTNSRRSSDGATYSDSSQTPRPQGRFTGQCLPHPSAGRRRCTVSSSLAIDLQPQTSIHAISQSCQLHTLRSATSRAGHARTHGNSSSGRQQQRCPRMQPLDVKNTLQQLPRQQRALPPPCTAPLECSSQSTAARLALHPMRTQHLSCNTPAGCTRRRCHTSHHCTQLAPHRRGPARHRARMRCGRHRPAPPPSASVHPPSLHPCLQTGFPLKVSMSAERC